MTPALLTQAGEALYGASWRAPLARDLGIDERTIRRWVAGTYPVPNGVTANLERIIADHAAELSRIVGEITGR